MNKCQEKDQIQEAKLNPENSNHIMEYGKLCLSISLLGQCCENKCPEEIMLENNFKVTEQRLLPISLEQY